MKCDECGGVLGHTRMCSKFTGWVSEQQDQVAAELRRQHALIEELREALRVAAMMTPRDDLYKKWSALVSKAEEYK